MDCRCVVTGEIFAIDFETDFLTYIEEVGGSSGGPVYGLSLGGVEDDDEEDEFDESMYDDEVESGDDLDIGEVVAQYLYLNLPEYPTKPGYSLEDISDEINIDLDPATGIPLNVNDEEEDTDEEEEEQEDD